MTSCGTGEYTWIRMTSINRLRAVPALSAAAAAWPFSRFEAHPGRSPWTTIIALLFSMLALNSPNCLATNALFGYAEAEQPDIVLFTQWLNALERHIQLDAAEADCEKIRFNRCHLREWYAFIESVRELPLAGQLQRINEYANNKHYVLDLDNYGLPDYWAVAREFLYNGGDCEDYAITKLFSLRWLGLSTDKLRIVVLQDTNLRVPHAVLAVYSGDEIFILDNQIQQVVKHSEIVHYTPVYSINEERWWIHTPVF